MTSTRHTRFLVTALLVAACLAGAARQARADGFVSPFIGYDFGGDAGCPDLTEIFECDSRNTNFGVAAGAIGNVFGVELEFAYAPDFFGERPGVDSSVLTLMGNLMFAPRFGPVQPYGLVGLGLIKTDASLSFDELLDSSNNHFGWDVGGGLMVFFSEHVGVRGDLRYFHAFQELDLLGVNLGDTKLDYGRASGAVVFRF